jgi:hypothetical protein
MEIHINRLIQMLHLRAKHMEICSNYKKSKMLDEVNAKFEVLRSWWYSTGAARGIDLEEFNHWLAFWHFQIH